MKIRAKLSQVESNRNGGFFNISEFDGEAISVSGIPSETFLFKEIDSDYGGYYLVSTKDIDSFMGYLGEINPTFLNKYKLIGSMRDIKHIECEGKR